MPKRLKNNIIERKGVNYVRELFEDKNCIFKEISREHDYGHDVHVGLVDGEKVLPKEIALQIKAGKSYITGNNCKIPSTKDHREFWRKHPFTTYGIVYDPDEDCAYFTNLKEYSQAHSDNKNYQTIVFQKSKWNKLDKYTFNNVWLNALLKKNITLTMDEAKEWSLDKDFVTCIVGITTLRRTYWNIPNTWEFFFDLFEVLQPHELVAELIYSLAHIPWHGDVFGEGSVQPHNTYPDGVERIKNYGKVEIIKLLSVVDEDHFNRGSVGQSVAAIVQKIDQYDFKLKEIIRYSETDDHVNEMAKILLYDYGFSSDLPF